MIPIRGYFSIVQFCPDLSRLESANIGVLLSCPETKMIDVRMSADNDRIRRFFNYSDNELEYVDRAKLALRNRIRTNAHCITTIEDLMAFINTRANNVILSKPRPIKVGDFEKDIEMLFDHLVGEPLCKDGGMPTGVMEEMGLDKIS